MKRQTLRRWVIASCIAAAMLVASAPAAQSARGAIANLFGRTDESGNLIVTLTAAQGTASARRAIGNLMGYTDGSGNLMVTLSSASGVYITPATATGSTVNDAGTLRQLTYKVTLAPAAFVCAAVTCDVTIATLPANTWVQNVTANVATVFACTATCTSTTLSAILGKGAGGAEYLASADIDAATAILGDADAEMGTLMTRAAAIQGGTFNTASTTVVLRMTSGTGNIGNGTVTNLSGGSLVVWLTTVRLQ